MQNRKGAYIVPERASLIAGRVEGHRDGYGFLIPDGEGDDIYLEPKQMSRVLHGDRVLVIGGPRSQGRLRRGGRRGAGRRQQPCRRPRLRRARHHLRGAGEQQDRQDILVPPEKVKVQVEGRPGSWSRSSSSRPKYSQPIGRIVEVLGNYADPGMEIEIALGSMICPSSSRRRRSTRRRNCRQGEEIGWGSRGPARPAAGDHRRRNGRDFDDAVWAKSRARAGGWWSPSPTSPLRAAGHGARQEAMTRGNSVYFPRR